MRGCSCGRCCAGVFNCTLAADVSDLGSRRHDVADTVAGAVQRRQWRQRWRHGNPGVHYCGERRRRRVDVSQDLRQDEASQDARTWAQEHLRKSWRHCVISYVISYVIDAVNHACALMQNSCDKSSAGPRISVLSNNPVTLKVITWHAHDVYEETKTRKLWLSFAQCLFSVHYTFRN